ncbi:unnamed protein product [Closterium sp. Naga37s-1]|nr:unnamed protein product [Closterium sp. Naga37s-1]
MTEKMLSIRDKKEIRDTKGNLLFNVADRLLSIPNKTEILDATAPFFRCFYRVIIRTTRTLPFLAHFFNMSSRSPPAVASYWPK